MPRTTSDWSSGVRCRPSSEKARKRVRIPYARDGFERRVLFLETPCKRADTMISHERQGMTPLLDFDYELSSGARNFDGPPTSALPRITRVGDNFRDDCVDDVNPWRAPVKSIAETQRETLVPLPDGHSAIMAEPVLSARSGEVLASWRMGSDAGIGEIFGAMSGTFHVTVASEQANHPVAAPNRE